jgi:hypothetical protein
MFTVADRARLRQTCDSHAVALCLRCRRGYSVAELDADGPQRGGWACPQCGADIGDSVEAHARLCPRFAAAGPAPAVRDDAWPARLPDADG